MLYQIQETKLPLVGLQSLLTHSETGQLTAQTHTVDSKCPLGCYKWLMWGHLVPLNTILSKPAPHKFLQ